MTDSDLTHQEGLVYAEVTTVLSELMARRYGELKQKHDGGVLTPSELAVSLAATFDDMGDLLQRYAERVRDSGMANLADALSLWGNGYEMRATQAKAALSQDDVDLALGLTLGVSDALKNNIQALDVIEARFGSGSRGLVKKALGYATPIGAGYTAYEAMVDFFDGNNKSAGARLFGILVGTAAGMFVTAGAAAPIVIAVTIGATVALLGNIAESAFNGVASMFGWEDPKDAQAAVLRAIKGSNNIALTHLGNHLFWGTEGDDVFVGFDDKPNDMVGGDGNDILEGNAEADYLNGGSGNDNLKGSAGNDRLKGGAGDDELDGGLGDDSLVGDAGFDIYRFKLDDFEHGATNDTIVDEDGQGRIYFEGLSISGTGIGFDTIHDSSFGTWLTSDEQFRLAVVGAGDNQTLIINHRSSGSRIVVNHWSNGDLGIELPDLEAVNPHNSAPLTNGDDMFGAGGSNAGKDEIDGLAGSDGLDGGAGNDVIDGGFDDDLILGGSGDDRLLGSYGNDVILDGSELINFVDWSDSVGSDGKSQRQQIEEDIAQWGLAVVGRGKGWYIHLNGAGSDSGFTIVTAQSKVDLDPNVSPSGDDFIDAGEGDDRVFAGEGNDTIIGGEGNDIISGGHDDDIINGGDGNDKIYGDQGDDAIPHVHFTALVSDIARKNGNDLIDAGAGNDQVAGGGGNDVLFGGEGDDILHGRLSSGFVDSDDEDRDYVDGGIGNDSIAGDDGDDTLLGGEGNDVIRGDNASPDTRNGNDRIFGGAGDDQLGGDGGDDVLYGEDGADTLIGDGADIDGSLHGTDLLYGGAGNDTLIGSGGDDALDGGDGDDVLLGDASESELAAVYHGNDFLSGGAGNDELQGNGGDDVLVGSVGDDTLFGGTGNDVLDGGEGVDQLVGGEGNDRLAGGTENDLLWGEAGDDELVGGEGDDELRGGVGKDVLSGGNGIDLLIGDDGDDTLDGGAGNDSLYGSAGADRLSGGDGDDYLDGDETAVPSAMHGNDTLDGGAGNDVIHGQGGDDVITGGDGDDKLFGDDYEKVFSGNDKVSGGAGNDVVDGGAGNDELLGDDGNDVLIGGDGDDQLTGGTGDDLIVGGAGNDTYHFESGFGTDWIQQVAGEDSGYDIISFGSSIAPSEFLYEAHGDDLIISDSASGDVLLVRDYFDPAALIDIQFASGGVLVQEDLQQLLGVGVPVSAGSGDDVVNGTEGKDRLYGGVGNDTLYGNAGDDYLNGGAGDDQIFGGAGNDVMEGGAGNDTYVINVGSLDTIIGLADGDSGSDVIRFGTSLTASMVTNYQITGADLMVFFLVNGSPSGVILEGFLAQTNGTHVIEFADGMRLTADNFRTGDNHWNGTAVDDVHVGSSGNDFLNGAGGNDMLSGMAGDDDLRGGDGDDTLSGDDGQDALFGGPGADVLNGGADNDQLYGDGIDVMSGGAGDDRYYIRYGQDNDLFYLPSDQVIEAAGEGVDTVYANAYSYTLTDNVENLIAVYDPSIWFETNSAFPGWHHDFSRELIGNALDNTITIAAPPASQTHQGHTYLLDGGAGADTLIGSDADEIYVVDQAGDQIIETSTSSIDTVRASYSYALGDNDYIEIVELTGSANISAWGNAGKNVLDGSTSTGANTLHGGAGDDHYVVDASDLVVESADAGLDTVVIARRLSGLSIGTAFSLAAYSNVENMQLGNQLRSGDWGGDLQGDAGNNVLTGNSYRNTIHGGDGSDTLIGGERDLDSSIPVKRDQLYGDAGNDVLRASSGGADLYGGTGNDELYGSASAADDFHYAVGDGTDTVYSSSGGNLDRVVFAADITPEMVSFSRDGSTLVVQVGPDPLDQLRIANYWQDTDGLVLSGVIDQLVFADGTIRKGGLDHLPYTNNAPVTVLTNLNAEATGDEPFSFELPQGMFSDAADDTLVLSLAPGAPSWLTLDSASGTLMGIPPNGGMEATLAIVATDSWGQTATAVMALKVRNVIFGTAQGDNLVGTLHRDDIHAGDGNDTLDGAGNSDRLFGGLGDDIYLITDSSATIIELGGEGTDTVNAHTNYILGENVERLILDADSSAFAGTGNSSDNEIVGNAHDNYLDGAAGADILTGGMGNDTYIVDQAGDQVRENAGEGIDTVEASVDWQLDDALENLTLVGDGNFNGTGNAIENILIGNEGNNRLEGGAGTDKLYGGGGDDYIVLETALDKAFEQFNGGTDTIERRFETDLVLDANVENLVLGTGILKGNGNDLANTLTGNAGANTMGGWEGNDLIQGFAGDDTLFGGNGVDHLLGGVGNDYLDGGTGVDVLDGGVGNDVYITDDASDSVVEAANEGTDQVQSTVSYVLSANIENLFLMEGAGAIDGTGNALDNYIAGNAASNVLHGMGGSDTMVAGAGSDVLIGGSGDDKYVFDATSGSDVVDNTGGGNDGIFFTGSITAERLSFSRDGDDLLIFVDATTVPAVRVTNHFLGGDAAIDYVQPDGGFMLTKAQINQIVAGSGSGGQYDQIIDGTASGEQLVGSAGKDLLKGLGGDDQLFGMAGDDVLQGGDGDDYLAGGDGSGTGSGADRLEGGIGNDMLVGEDGTNLMVGGAGDDSYIYGGGRDTIDNSDGGFDGVFFNDGITAAQLGFSRDVDDLLITVDGDANSTVRVSNHFLGDGYAIDYVQPATGSMLDTAAINALIGGGPGGGSPPDNTGNDGDYTNLVDGTASGEQLLGSGGRDLIRGLGGNDTIFGFGGDDKFEGGDGDDYLSGGNGSFAGSGNDILIGGAGVDTLVGEDGSDVLIGGMGDDKYVWQAGSGSDLIDNSGGGTDWLFFNGVDRTRLSFHKDAEDLVIMVDGNASQQVRVQNHFRGGELAISYVQPSDGYAIPASQFGGLLTPMPVGIVSTETKFAMSSIPPVARDLIAATTALIASATNTGQISSSLIHHQELPLTESDDSVAGVALGFRTNQVLDATASSNPGSETSASEFASTFLSIPAEIVSAEMKFSELSRRAAPGVFIPMPSEVIASAMDTSLIPNFSTRQHEMLHMEWDTLVAEVAFADGGLRHTRFDSDSSSSQNTSMGRETQRLVEAMSRFQPISGDAGFPHYDFGFQDTPFAVNHGAKHRPMQTHQMSIL